MVAWTAAVMAAACGGGGGDDSNAPATAPNAVSNGGEASPAAAPSSGPTETPQTLPGPVAKADCGMPDLAVEMLRRLNVERARGAQCGARGTFAPAGPLGWNTKLEDAAIAHSRDMATRNFFSHVSSDGGTLADRVNVTGYMWALLGENIAAGFTSAESTVAGWMASDGHCVNVMQPDFKDVAIACVAGTAGSQYRTYWTLDFGKPT